MKKENKVFEPVGLERDVKEELRELIRDVKPLTLTYSALVSKALQALKDRISEEPEFLFGNYPAMKDTKSTPEAQEVA